jgi:hypothetical protein
MKRHARLSAIPAVIALCVVVGTTTASATAGPWTGTFAGFSSATWAAQWGLATEKSWGFEHMATPADPTAPTSPVLDVRYGKGSSAQSCTDCPTTGGGEFYTLFRQLGRADLINATSLSLKYFLRFPTDYDFGRGGKLPGLFGGEIGQESGGTHGNGWSTRYMWRAHKTPGDGEVYFYSPTGSGFGKDLGLGKWKFAADGRWHSIEQRVDRKAQTITVWYDAKLVLRTTVTGISKIPFSGVFFSTFFGGHESRWGPRRTVHSYFSTFTVTT